MAIDNVIYNLFYRPTAFSVCRIQLVILYFF